jgi:hypothetical protein
MASAAGLVDRLVAALLEEEEARRAVRDALREQAELLRELRAAGLPASRVAHRVALARGLVLKIEERQRFAARLRQRLSRVTRRHGDLAGPHGLGPTAGSGFGRAIMPEEDADMPKLVKRTVVEEFVEPDDRDEHDEDEIDEDEIEEAEDDDVPASRRRAKASRK